MYNLTLNIHKQLWADSKRFFNSFFRLLLMSFFDSKSSSQLLFTIAWHASKLSIKLIRLHLIKHNAVYLHRTLIFTSLSISSRSWLTIWRRYVALSDRCTATSVTKAWSFEMLKINRSRKAESTSTELLDDDFRAISFSERSSPIRKNLANVSEPSIL